MTEIHSVINWKKIGLYILIAFGFCWSIAGLMKLTHIEYGSTSSILIIGVLYMPGPALATLIIQKFIYKQGFKQYGWTFEKKKLRWFLYAILIFLVIMLLTLAVIGLFGNTNIISQFGQLDFSQENFNTQFTKLLQGKVNIDNIKLPNIPSWLFFIIMMAEGIIAGLTVNIPFMFGEEFGWRGLLLKETQPMGFVQSNIFIGTIWGLWHLPIVLMGHNYPHYPYFGIVMMCLMTIALSPIFAYIRLKTESILGPCVLHGMINATASLFTLYVANGNELYSSIAGWGGIIACALVSVLVFVFDTSFVRNYSTLEQDILTEKQSNHTIHPTIYDSN